MLSPKCRAMSFVRPPRAAMSLICRITAGGTVGGMGSSGDEMRNAECEITGAESIEGTAGVGSFRVPHSEFRVLPVPLLVEIVPALGRIDSAAPQLFLLVVQRD